MKHQCSMRRLTITGGSEKDVRVSRRMDCRFGVIKSHVSDNNKNLYVSWLMCHVYKFMCYSFVELKLKINTRSLFNRTLNRAHPPLFCCALLALRSIQLMTGKPRPRYNALQLLGVSGACGPFHSPNTFAHAQDSARCHAGMSVEQPKTSSSVVVTLDTPDTPGYISKIQQICTRPSPTTNLTWIWLWWCQRYHVTAIKKECSRQVRRSTTRWFLWYQRVRFLTTITRYVILMICQWKLTKI